LIPEFVIRITQQLGVGGILFKVNTLRVEYRNGLTRMAEDRLIQILAQSSL
jgi:hypothetical protein